MIRHSNVNLAHVVTRLLVGDEVYNEAWFVVASPVVESARAIVWSGTCKAALRALRPEIVNEVWLIVRHHVAGPQDYIRSIEHPIINQIRDRLDPPQGDQNHGHRQNTHPDQAS